MSNYKSEHLNSVLESYRMKHIEDLISKYKERRDNIISFLQEQYDNKIYDPFYSGSYKKHTAINAKFDLDVVVPFKYNSFSTLEAMFDDIFNKIKQQYQDQTTVRKQGVSIGLTFEGDDEINIDIVPARETSQDNFPTQKNLNLHKTQGDGYLKTNIHAQIDHIKARENERKIIRLLKAWKYQNSYKYKSFFIELLVIKAYENAVPQGNLWEQLKNVLQYTIENITQDNFKLKDPGNSNNDLMATLDNDEKTRLKTEFKQIIDNIESNEKNIEFYFPKNKKFANDESVTDKTYGVKSSVLISTPPQSQRFG